MHMLLLEKVLTQVHVYKRLSGRSVHVLAYYHTGGSLNQSRFEMSVLEPHTHNVKSARAQVCARASFVFMDTLSSRSALTFRCIDLFKHPIEISLQRP